MSFEPPERLNIADFFLDARVREGRGGRVALHTDAGPRSYADVQALANRFGNALAGAGVQPEHRVLIALPDGPEFVGALFGTLKLGAIVVMANPALPQDELGHLVEYVRPKAVVTHRDTVGAVHEAIGSSAFGKTVLAVGDPLESTCRHASLSIL